MKKIAHYFKTVKFWFAQKKKKKIVKAIRSLIFPKCLVLLKKDCAWEEKVVLRYFTIHFTLCLIFIRI